LFSLALGKTEGDFKTVQLIFFINVLDESLEVLGRFISFGGFGWHINILKRISRVIIAQIGAESERGEG
jgi:hypothetical protein